MNFGKVLEIVGGSTLRHLEYVGGLTIQLRQAAGSLPRSLPLVGNRNRWRSAFQQMVAIGIGAIPMVAVMAVCAGFILAMQGASELRRFGAIHFVIDLVTIGFTRELGPLLTAIAVSGRSGSAFSAEIGSMVVSEEIDALRTMAIDPVEFVRSMVDRSCARSGRIATVSEACKGNLAAIRTDAIVSFQF